MKMKISKRSWIAIGVASVLAGAAIAIPIGVVYGVKASAPVPTPNTVDLDRSGEAAKNIDYAWGTKGADVAAPVLAEKDYLVSDYDTGTFQSTTVKSDTALGTGTATIVFLYAPKTAGKPPLRITYALNVKKGYSKDLSKATAQTVDRVFEAEKSPEQYFTDWMAANGYGYKITSTDYKKVDKSTSAESASTLAEVLALGKGEKFKAVYHADLDTVHYETTDKAGTGASTIAASTTFTVTFNVVEAQAAKPAVTTFGHIYPVGSTENSGEPPVNPYEADYKGYMLTNTVASKITVQSAKPADATHLSPAKDADFDANALDKYNEGTGFDVTYSYKAKDNYAGTDFSVTINWVVGTIAPEQGKATVANVNYGTTTSAGDNVALPTKATASVPSAQLGGWGYDDGVASDKVTGAGVDGLQHDVDVTKNPVKGQEYDYAAIASWNAGSEFTVDLTYNPLAGKSGDPVVIKRTFKIVPQVKTPMADAATNPAADDNIYSYYEGDPITTVNTPAAAQGKTGAVTFDPAVYTLVKQDGKDYSIYKGSQPPASGTAITPLTDEQVLALKANAANVADKRFTVKFVYAFNSNYTQAKDFVKTAGGKQDGQVTYLVAFEVKDASTKPTTTAP